MIAWAFLVLVVLPLFVLMLRRMFFDMLDRRAADEYLRALDEMPVARSLAPRVPAPDYRWEGYHVEKAYRQLLDQGYSHASAMRDVEKARQYVYGDTVFRRAAMYANISGPHVAMMVGEDGRVISPNYSPGPVRFQEIADQL